MSARELSLGEVCSMFLWTDKRTDSAIRIPTGSLSDKSITYVISEKVPSVLFQVKMMIWVRNTRPIWPRGCEQGRKSSSSLVITLRSKSFYNKTPFKREKRRNRNQPVRKKCTFGVNMNLSEITYCIRSSHQLFAHFHQKIYHTLHAIYFNTLLWINHSKQKVQRPMETLNKRSL